MQLDLASFLRVSLILFLLGLSGIMLNRRNIIVVLMSIELMLLAVNLNFIVFSVFLDDLMGQVFALFVLTVAAAESAIGLAILVVYYRVRGSIAIQSINLMHGLNIYISLYIYIYLYIYKEISLFIIIIGELAEWFKASDF